MFTGRYTRGQRPTQSGYDGENASIAIDCPHQAMGRLKVKDIDELFLAIANRLCRDPARMIYPTCILLKILSFSIALITITL